MKRSTIGGPLNLGALAALAGVDRKQQQPPPERDIARAAAVELRARGLTPLDISQALGISEGAVHDLLSIPIQKET